MKALHVPKWYLVVIGAVAVQRLGELAISRSNEAGIRGVRAASSHLPADGFSSRRTRHLAACRGGAARVGSPPKMAVGGIAGGRDLPTLLEHS
jgi:hypothetical protein